MATSQDTLFASELKSALDRFSDYLYARLKLRETTIANYLGVLRRAAPVIGLQPSLEIIERYLANLHRRNGSYAHVTITAVALERYKESLGDPIKLPRPSKPKRRHPEPLSEIDIALMIRLAPDARSKAMLSVLAYSGIRNQEMCSLEIGDIDMAAQIIHVRCGKGGNDREVHIAGSCVQVLAEYLRERNGHRCDRLFVTKRHGLPYQPQDLRKFVRAAARRADIQTRVHPHLFRHSLATNMLNRGAGVYTIKDQLGHRYLTTTALYLHSATVRRSAEYRMFAPSYM